MAYVKNVWSKGDEITAEKLNNIESGIEGASSGSGSNAPLIVTDDLEATITAGYTVSDTTYAEIEEAVLAGKQVWWRTRAMLNDDETGHGYIPLTDISYTSSAARPYSIMFGLGGDNYSYVYLYASTDDEVMTADDGSSDDGDAT